MEDAQMLELEEKLRESASIGDIGNLRTLVEHKHVDINSQNQMNGRSALHWGAKRNHKTVVEYLLAQGADREAMDKDGKTAEQLTTNSDVYSVLGGSGDLTSKEESLPIVPNYLAHPPFPYGSDKQMPSLPSLNNGVSSTNNRISQPVEMINHNNSMSHEDELVVKIRVANLEDGDFIEAELPRTQLTYQALLNLMCAELGVDKQLVYRVRKLPNTVLRKDKDVGRLQDFTELELVLTNKAASATSRQYKGVQAIPNMTTQQILY